jgi:hypothetical protein
MSIQSRAMRALSSVAVFGGVALCAGAAHADYVCSAIFIPTNSTAGSEGYVMFSAYAGPNCTGGFLQNWYFCSAGATSVNCAANPGYRYDRQSLLAMYGVLQRAASVDQRVYTGNQQCLGAAIAYCAGYLQVRGD